ncbi:MAG TPA: hypothetical protein VFY04_01260 [Solirubrobacterales bacterium]|nr:hypothetical protein [Solirubrobacterales bacterium]
MSLDRRLFALLALLVLALPAAGCGDDESGAQANEPSAAFSEILTGLKDAAASDGKYKASKRALELEPGEKEVIRSYCETVWQLEINGELDRLERYGYMVGRIRNLAEYDNPGKYSKEVGPAMDELLHVVDLRALDAKDVHRYKKACYQ